MGFLSGLTGYIVGDFTNHAYQRYLISITIQNLFNIASQRGDSAQQKNRYGRFWWMSPPSTDIQRFKAGT